ncbi:MAG: Tfp pilus assembly protein FimT/FimU [Leptothrix sp. (in: b-proteobacteria)]
MPRPRGFTLLELLIVVAILAIASSVVSLALPDPQRTRLEHEAARLASLLEGGRAQSRSLGVPVRWLPGAAASRNGDVSADDFHFDGLPEGGDLPTRWLDAQGGEPVIAELPARSGNGVNGANAAYGLQLGPEPVIGAQSLTLRIGDQHLTIATDGIGPFQIVTDTPPDAAGGR